MIRHYFFRLVSLGGFCRDRFGWGRFGLDFFGWSGLPGQTLGQSPAVGALTFGVSTTAFERFLIATIGDAVIGPEGGGAASLTAIDPLLVAGTAEKE